jgi:glycosyltransferase involved in cell wall biosynthesis
MQICFVSDKLISYFSDKDLSPGGSERQQFALMNELHDLGFEISMISGNVQVKDELSPDWVNIYNFINYNRGIIAGVQKVVQLYRGFKISDANLYYVQGNPWILILTAIYMSFVNKTLIHHVASDLHIFPQLQSSKQRWVVIYLYNRFIKEADLVYCQSKSQRRCLAEIHRVDAKILKFTEDDKFVFDQSNDVQLTNSKECKNSIIWIGRVVEEKQPEIFMELPKLLPDYHFKLVGPSSGNYQKRLRTLAAKLDNFEYLGAMNKDKLFEIYSNSDLLISTQPYSDVPLVVVEAWLSGIPVISADESFFENEMEFKVGICGDGRIKSLKCNIRYLMENDTERHKMGNYARHYALSRYSSVEAAKTIFSDVNSLVN